MVHLALLVGALYGCGKHGPVGEDPATLDPPLDDDTETRSDTDGEAHSDPVPDTDRPDDSAHTDAGPESDPQVDSDPPPPRDLGLGFVDLTAPLFGAWPRDVAVRDALNGQESDQTHGFFADLDGDGRLEVVLIGTAPAPGVPREPWVLRYDALATTLTPDPTLTARLSQLDPLLLGLVDLDGDGALDAIPGRSTEPVLFADAAGVLPRPREVLPYDPGQLTGQLVDLDADGWTDVLRVSGGCRLMTSWVAAIRAGPASFIDRSSMLGAEAPSSPYAVGVMPVGGVPYVLGLGLGCDQARPAPGFFVPGPASFDGYAVFAGADLTPPNAAYKLDPFVAGGPVTRRNPMGGVIADLDGDGDLDLALATVDERVLLFEQRGPPPFVDRTLDWDAHLPERADDGSGLASYEHIKPWGITAIDLDLDGDLDLVVQTGNDFSDNRNRTPGENLLVAFFQHNGAFELDAEAAGLGMPSDGRSLTVGDLDGDGRPDLIVGGLGRTPRVLLNRCDGPRPPIALTLRGTSSPIVPSGAEVRVIDDGVAGPTQMIGATISPGPLSAATVFGTTGPDAVADLVRITWPSGYLQEIPSLTANTEHVVVEPVTVALEPETRRLPLSDGPARLLLTPRDPSGAPTGAAVRVEVRGEGAVSAPRDLGGGTWEVLVSPGVSPGWTLLDLWFDQAQLPIHPRLTWTTP